MDWKKMLIMHQELNQFARVMLEKKQKEFLTSSERELLACIYLTKKNCTPLYLSNITGMKKEAVSRCLKSLFEKECIKKEKDSTDERSYLLVLTPTGDDFLKNDYEIMLKKFYELYREMGDDFNELFNLISNANKFLSCEVK